MNKLQEDIYSDLDKETIDLIVNALRQASIKWSGRKSCLQRARKKVHVGRTKEGKDKFKFHWQCNECKEWYSDQKMVEVDHIIEVGPYKGNLHEYAKRLFCRVDNLQALCSVCHQKKTSGYNSTRLHLRKVRT